MRTITYKSTDLDKVQLNLGFAGENKRTRVIIDCETEFTEYPSAVPYMVVTPPRGEKYPGVISKSGNTVLWDVTDSDLIYDGNGSIQLKFVQDEVVCKTYSAKTKILKADDPTGSTPTPIQNWIDHANEVLETLEQAEIHAPIIDANGYWNIWDADDEQYINTGVRAIGQNGTNGKDGKDGKDGIDATPALITVDYNDLTFPVAKDTLCYHSGLMYQAKQDIPLQEDWTAAHWEVTTVEEQERAIKRDISALDATKIKMDATDQTSQSVSNKFSQIDGSVASVNNALSGKVSEPAQEGTAGSVMTTDGDGHRSWTELANTEADMSVSGTTLVIASRGGGGGDTGTFTQIYSATLAENTASIDVTRKDNNTGDTFTTNKILAMFEIPASTKTSFKVFVPYGSTTDGVFYESLGDATYKFYINVLMEIKCGRLFGCITGSTNQTNRSGNYNTSNNLNGYLEASELTRATFSRGGDGFPTGTKVKVYIAE